MNAFDRLELDLLAATGDIDSAELAGQIARHAVIVAIQSNAYILGQEFTIDDINAAAARLLGY